MKLKDLIKGIPVKSWKGNLEVEILGISYDSRKVSFGDLFVCIPGAKDDGHNYVKQAGDRGAVGFLASREVEIEPEKALVVVDEPRAEMGKLASRLAGEPSKKMEVIGITGTNGKTTISYLIEAISRSEGKECGVIGTVSYRWKGKEIPATNTTPESVEIINLLKSMLEDGVQRAVLEVSSHSLAQKRVAGIEFKAGIFTNLSPEHLDYHKDLEDYFQAKARLFTEVLTGKWLLEPGLNQPISLINLDDPYGRRLFQTATGKRVSYGISSPDAHYQAEILKMNWEGLEMKISSPKGDFLLKSKLVGRPNALNLLASSAMMLELGTPIDKIQAGIEALKKIPGRMEIIQGKNGLKVVVDYAHTPDALEKVLQCLRELAPKRLLVVFGCGGDRDRSKRPKMGEISARYGDLVIITSDNPRTEDPLKIISEIEPGVKKAGMEKLKHFNSTSQGYLIEPERRKAIEIALELAGEEDCVLVAGKGHEDYQIIGEQKIHFDDREEVRKILGLNQEK